MQYAKGDKVSFVSYGGRKRGEVTEVEIFRRDGSTKDEIRLVISCNDGLNYHRYPGLEPVEKIHPVNIPMERLESFPPKANPYHHDAFHMGIAMGKDLVLMYSNHPSGECEYLIFINTRTGERFRMDLKGFMQYEKED